jgi:4a-hydroxytetrahydrobiopterin dehydratase
MSELASRRCEPCRGGVPPLKPEEYEPLKAQLHGDWEVVNGHHLTRLYKFKNFADALAFVNAVGDLAEEVNHHPDLHLAWGQVRVEIWTHKIDGLHEADFIFAAKCDRIHGD